MVFGTHIFILLFVGVLKNLLSSKALVNVNKYHEKMYILGITFLKVCTLHIRLYKHRTWFLVVVFFFIISNTYTFEYISLLYFAAKYWFPYKILDLGLKKKYDCKTLPLPPPYFLLLFDRKFAHYIGHLRNRCNDIPFIFFIYITKL